MYPRGVSPLHCRPPVSCTLLGNRNRPPPRVCLRRSFKARLRHLCKQAGESTRQRSFSLLPSSSLGGAASFLSLSLSLSLSLFPRDFPTPFLFPSFPFYVIPPPPPPHLHLDQLIWLSSGESPQFLVLLFLLLPFFRTGIIFSIRMRGAHPSPAALLLREHHVHKIKERFRIFFFVAGCKNIFTVRKPQACIFLKKS